MVPTERHTRTSTTRFDRASRGGHAIQIPDLEVAPEMAPDEPLTIQEALISRREAMRLTGLSYNGIRNWEKTGKLTPRRVMAGQQEQIRYLADEVQAAIADRERTRAEMRSHPSREVEAQVAVLEAENRFLRERVEALTKEVGELLSTITEIAKGR